MKNIILTVRNRDDEFQYDMEVLVDLKGDKLTDDVVEALNGIRPELCYNSLYHGLYLNRLGRFLKDGETIAEAGVHNGDYVTIMAKRY